MQTPDGLQQLREWADCYKKAMGARDFPYFHVEQVSIRQHTSAYVSIRQHTSAYVCIR
jgi:hypothetical protein